MKNDFLFLGKKLDKEKYQEVVDLIAEFSNKMLTQNSDLSRDELLTAILTYLDLSIEEAMDRLSVMHQHN